MKQYLVPSQLRAAIRAGAFTGRIPGQCPGFVQANLAILPADYADSFAQFAAKNAKACPILERLPAGSRRISRLADAADVATDLPRYRVFEHGEFQYECTDISGLWRDDLVSFLIGCSFSFEDALAAGGIPMKYGADGKSGPVYYTNLPCEPAGPFSGTVAVSMRPVKRGKVADAVAITERFPHVHGGPVHIGDPAAIGISDIGAPVFGSRIPIGPDEVPVFWACGVTPQLAILSAKPPIAITHAAGHMFVSDLKNSGLEQTLFA